MYQGCQRSVANRAKDDGSNKEGQWIGTYLVEITKDY